MGKNQLQITGYSDDIISLDGSIYDEFSPSADDNTAIIKLPDGSIIKFYYDSDGIWRGKILEDKTATHGIYRITIEKGDAETDTNDVVKIDYPIRYITWTCADGSKGILGNIHFSDETHKKYKEICDAVDGVQIEDMGNTVKAIIEGIEF